MSKLDLKIDFIKKISKELCNSQNFDVLNLSKNNTSTLVNSNKLIKSAATSEDIENSWVNLKQNLIKDLRTNSVGDNDNFKSLFSLEKFVSHIFENNIKYLNSTIVSKNPKDLISPIPFNNDFYVSKVGFLRFVKSISENNKNPIIERLINNISKSFENIIPTNFKDSPVIFNKNNLILKEEDIKSKSNFSKAINTNDPNVNVSALISIKKDLPIYDNEINKLISDYMLEDSFVLINKPTINHPGRNIKITIGDLKNSDFLNTYKNFSIHYNHIKKQIDSKELDLSQLNLPNDFKYSFNLMYEVLDNLQSLLSDSLYEPVHKIINNAISIISNNKVTTPLDVKTINDISEKSEIEKSKDKSSNIEDKEIKSQNLNRLLSAFPIRDGNLNLGALHSFLNLIDQFLPTFSGSTNKIRTLSQDIRKIADVGVLSRSTSFDIIKTMVKQEHSNSATAAHFATGAILNSWNDLVNYLSHLNEELRSSFENNFSDLKKVFDINAVQSRLMSGSVSRLLDSTKHGKK